MRLNHSWSVVALTTKSYLLTNWCSLQKTLQLTVSQNQAVHRTSQSTTVDHVNDSRQRGKQPPNRPMQKRLPHATIDRVWTATTNGPTRDDRRHARLVDIDAQIVRRLIISRSAARAMTVGIQYMHPLISWLNAAINASITCRPKKTSNMYTSVVTIPDFAMRYVSRYLGHDAIRIAILVYRVSQCLDCNLSMMAMQYIGLGTLYSITTIGAECAGRWPNVYTLSDASPETTLPQTSVKVENAHLTMMLDTGSSINVIDERTFATLRQRPKLTWEVRTKRYHAKDISPLQSNMLLATWTGHDCLGKLTLTRAITRSCWMRRHAT